MHMRVVRFTDVDPEHMQSQLSARADQEGPPEGVKASGIKVMHDPDQRTSVVIQFFETEQDMRDSEAALDGMDPSETPGARASVDRGEIVFEREAQGAS
jgi:hypothetical protein